VSTDLPDDSHEDEDKAPRRRRKAWRDEDDFHRDKRDDVTDDYDEYLGDKRELALSKVRAPAWLMIIGGIIFSLGGIATVVGGIIMSLNAPQNGDEIFGYVVIGFGVLSIPLFTVLTVGAFRMKSLRSYFLAITSSILSIMSIFIVCFCGLFGVFGLLMVPVGVWSLVVLLDAEVVREFKRVERGASNHRERDDDDEPRT